MFSKQTVLFPNCAFLEETNASTPDVANPLSGLFTRNVLDLRWTSLRWPVVHSNALSKASLSCDYSSHFRGRDQMNKYKASKTTLLLCTTTTSQFHIWCEIIIFFCNFFLRLSQVKVRLWGHFYIVGVCFPPDTHAVNVTIYRRFWTRTSCTKNNTRQKYFTLWYSTFSGKLWHASLGTNQSSTHKDGVFYEHLNLMIKKSHVEINSNKVNMDIN